MIVVRVILENGNSWITSINAAFREASDYFLNAEGFEQSDNSVSPVVSVVRVK